MNASRQCQVGIIVNWNVSRSPRPETGSRSFELVIYLFKFTESRCSQVDRLEMRQQTIKSGGTTWSLKSYPQKSRSSSLCSGEECFVTKTMHLRTDSPSATALAIVLVGIKWMRGLVWLWRREILWLQRLQFTVTGWYSGRRVSPERTRADGLFNLNPCQFLKKLAVENFDNFL
jgi:hypothetical protein